MLQWTYEDEATSQNVVLCGLDEAGRGPLAGRVYAAAVVLDGLTRDNEVFKILDDSKKLTEKRRDAIAPVIKQLALSWCVAYSTVQEIEETDILSAALLAMRRAANGLGVDRDIADEEFLDDNCLCCLGGKAMQPGFLLVDGSVCREFTYPAKALVGGDGICPSIAAASILAKTERDKYCYEVLDVLYPEYGFAKHKGYGTKAHYAAVDEFGLCPEHRQSFFKKYYAKKI